MKGEIINCSAHKDIYFLETNTKNEIYNAHETGLLWRTLPESIQTSKYEKSNPGRKISKDRISALLCANADGSHRLAPVIVGKSRKPRVLKDIMHHLPGSYYNSNKSTDLANLFAPPTGRDVFKYKPRLKLKQKVNPALEFFIQNKSKNSSLDQSTHKPSNTYQDDGKCPLASSSGTLDGCRTRRSSIDLYEEAASILGLTCAQTDDCKCLECQCHYFDFEEEIDFPTGSECVVEVDHSSSCSIQ